MRRRLFSAVLVVVATLIGDAAYAATKYVNNSGSPACSNSSGAGTLSQPFCTISYGVAHIAGGDTLNVQAGTYSEYPDVPSAISGTSSQSTVIQAYPTGASVIIRGGGNTGHIGISGVSWLVWSGFEVTNMNQGVFVDTASFHVTLSGITVHDVGQEAIHIKTGANFITVENSTVYNKYKLGGCCNGEGIYVGSSCTASADQWTHDITLRNNTIHDTGSEGIELKPGTYNGIIDGNTLYRTNQVDTGVGQAAIEVNERDCSPQGWTGNPSHVVRNNVVHDNEIGIRLGTGSTAYNNISYNPVTTFGYGRGISIDNLNGDSFTRFVYHNTVHQTSNAIVNSGATVDIRNNIGASGTKNLAFNAAYFVNATAHDYHLVAGSAPIDTGADVTSVVSTDIEGNPRPIGTFPDIGAYEYTGNVKPTAPTNLRISG